MDVRAIPSGDVWGRALGGAALGGMLLRKAQSLRLGR